MEALRIRKTLDKDGEITVEDLPCKKGEEVEVILLLEPSQARQKRLPTVNDLVESGLVGMWKDRTDIEDSAAFARKLRDEALRGSG